MAFRGASSAVPTWAASSSERLAKTDDVSIPAPFQSQQKKTDVPLRLFSYKREKATEEEKDGGE